MYIKPINDNILIECLTDEEEKLLGYNFLRPDFCIGTVFEVADNMPIKIEDKVLFWPTKQIIIDDICYWVVKISDIFGIVEPERQEFGGHDLLPSIQPSVQSSYSTVIGYGVVLDLPHYVVITPMLLDEATDAELEGHKLAEWILFTDELRELINKYNPGLLEKKRATK